MAIDPSMEPMLEVFIYETTTLLEQLDEILLSSEKSKNFSEDAINEIFRIMHTIKGSAAMMDLTGISTLAHAVEDVFFIIREQPARALENSEALFDLVFEGVDFLKEEMESVQGTGEADRDPQDLIRQLHAMAAAMKGEAPQAAPPKAAPAGTGSGLPTDGGIHKVQVFFEDGCQMENIRAFMLLSQLQDLCEELTSIPAHPESDSSLCAEIVKNGLTILFKPAAPLAEIYGVIERSINIKSYQVLEDQTPGAPASAHPASGTAAAPGGQPAAQQAAQPKSVGRQQNLISVNQVKLDQLMDLVGELVTTESMVVSSPDLRGLPLDGFHKSARELRKLTDELQDVVMSMRMVPLSGVFQKMNRIVRDMCKKLDKQAELVTIGGDTEVDKTINEAIADPFMHMVRNAVDHAIEEPEERLRLGKPPAGTVTMEAKNVGGEIVITIADDGRGLDTEALLEKARSAGLLTKPEAQYTDKEIYSLILLPGFSTNREVTEFSGRGVGMDVVRKNIEKVGGSISIDSEKGRGTVFTIKIPLTLAIVDGMMLAVGGAAFALPITSIRQSFKLADPGDVIRDTDGTEMMMLRGECLPLIRLHRIFDCDTQVTDLTQGILIQVDSGSRGACLFADELLGEQQVVVKPFPSFLGKYSLKQMGLSGCSILGDGSISLILDAANLLTLH